MEKNLKKNIGIIYLYTHTHTHTHTQLNYLVVHLKLTHCEIIQFKKRGKEMKT